MVAGWEGTALRGFDREHQQICNNANYCAVCHDSPHAIAPSSQPNDAIKFVALQGHAGTLEERTICHLTRPEGAGQHEAGQVVPTRQVVRVGDIQASYRPDHESGYRLRGLVLIIDEQGPPVREAKVKVEGERPDGSTQDADGKTRSDGQVAFEMRTSRQGTCTFRVLRVKKPEYAYDPSLNVETSEGLSVPSEDGGGRGWQVLGGRATHPHPPEVETGSQESQADEPAWLSRRHSLPKTWRAMTSRWISLVPSPIVHSRWSR